MSYQEAKKLHISYEDIHPISECSDCEDIEMGFSKCMRKHRIFGDVLQIGWTMDKCE